MALFSLKNLGSAFISDEKACRDARRLYEKGLMPIAQLNACVSTTSERRQEAQRTLGLIGAIGIGIFLLR